MSIRFSRVLIKTIDSSITFLVGEIPTSIADLNGRKASDSLKKYFKEEHIPKNESFEFNGISTHSFRKFFATEIYKSSGYDIALVQHLLQHSSAAITQKYIGIQPQRIEQAIEEHARLIYNNRELDAPCYSLIIVDINNLNGENI